MYATQFEVVSKYPFPLDMLRYDACYPERSEDAATIGYSLDPEQQGGDSFVVRLIRFHKTRYWEPTVGRWSSFMWSVRPSSIETRRID